MFILGFKLIKNKTDLEHNSIFVSISLKNETYPSIVSRLNIWTFISFACKAGEMKVSRHVTHLFILELSYLTVILGESTNH